MYKSILLFAVLFVLGCSEITGTDSHTLTIDVDISNSVTVSFDNGQSIQVSAGGVGLISLEEGTYNYS